METGSTKNKGRAMAHTDRLGMFKLEATFGKDYVTHIKGRSRWWERGQGGIEKWEQVRKLGEGGHGAVYLQERKIPFEQRAVKKLEPKFLKESCRLDFQRELHTLIAVRQKPDLFVQFLGWYEDKPGGFVFFAMEYLEDGDLGGYLESRGPLGDIAAKAITKQLLDGLEFLHQSGICHRDLKPQNILMASKPLIRVKIADFGVSKSSRSSILSIRRGTMAYMAPEMLGMLDGENECTNAVDIWALGCILYEMLTLETPFMERSLNGRVSSWMISTMSGILPISGLALTNTKLLSDFCKGNIELPSPSSRNSSIGDSTLNFVKQLLVPDPKHRPSASNALSYGWAQDMFSALKSQWTSLGIKSPFESAISFLVECKGRQDMGVSTLLSPLMSEDIGALLFKSASKGYVLITEMLLDFYLRLMGEDSLREIEHIYITDGVPGGAGKPITRAQTILQAAAANGHIDIVRLLLVAGANVNTTAGGGGSGGQTIIGRTAIQAAAENGHLELVKVLLENGAEIDGALGAAVEGGHFEIVKVLLENGAEASTALGAAVEVRHFDIVQFLLENGAEANSVVGAAVESGHFEIVKVLLENGAEVNTALGAAVESGHFEMVQFLLENGAEINTLIKGWGRTVLQAAMESGRFEVLQFLLENRAEINTPIKCWGRRILRAAVESGNSEIVQFLLENGAKGKGSQEALAFAVECGYYEVVKTLIEQGARISTGEYKHTLLRVAVENGHMEVVKLLLENGADVNTAPEIHGGRTALQAAAGCGHLEILALLLKNGAEINDAPAKYRGRTALQAAVENGHFQSVELLLEAGAEVGAAPSPYYGLTALQAAAGRDPKVLKLLLESSGIKSNI